MSNPDVPTIVRSWLRDKGYDGLANLDNDGCGCTLDDFAPCGQIEQSCTAAYKHDCRPADCDTCELDCCDHPPAERIDGHWVMKLEKPKPPRMVLCWKCSSGTMVGKGIYCSEAKAMVTDFQNPPAGCPVVAQWEEEDKVK